jgi:hypothetical protein
MLRKLAGVGLAVLVAGSTAAYADSGSLNDPRGDFPDIVKLRYNNADGKVVMKMTYAGTRAQNESFYMRWGKGASKYYQVFVSESAGMEELRLNGDKVKCARLAVKRPSELTTKVVVPRKCLKKAPDKLRFQGIATEGLFSADETKVSKAVARG